MVMNTTAPPSDAAHSTSNSAGEPSSAMPSSSGELEQARQELQQCQEKFALWKEKAKAGVDHLRAQIIDLTQRLDRSEKQLAAGRACDATPLEKLSSSLEGQSDVMSAHALAAASLLIDSFSVPFRSPASPAGTAPPAASPRSSPSRDQAVEQLQRTVQDQSDRLKEVHHALKRSTNELQQRNAALQQQDETLAAMKRRVETLEMANASLEQQLMNVPNVDEWRQAQEELDHQLERSRLEYESRESDLVLQHSNEIQALNASHEQDIRELQREAEERTLRAVQNALASQALATASSAGAAPAQQREREEEDAAYMGLLHDYRALQAQWAATAKERGAALKQQNALLRELQDLFRAVGTGGMVATTPRTDNGSSADDMTMEEAVRQVAEQRVRLVALQEELSRSRREVLQLKRSKPSVPVDGLGAQQTQYVRSVVVQLLCSLNDAAVAKRLLPVLSMLLKFSDDDLAAVTKAMPQWKSHR